MLSRVRLGLVWGRRGIASLSIRQGPTTPPLSHKTIPEHFSSIVSLYGPSPALIARPSSPPALTLTHPSTTLSFSALDTLSNRLASSLSSINVHHGVRVAALLGNTVEHAILVFALAKLGAILVPLNPILQPGQVASALNHVGAHTLVVSAFADLAYRPGRGRSNEPLLAHLLGDSLNSHSGQIESEAVPSLRNVVVVDNREYHAHPDAVGGSFSIDRPSLLHFADLLGQGSEGAVKSTKKIEAEDIANIQFTSGTTATPKAAMLSHLSTLNNALGVAHQMSFSPRDSIVVPPPLFHCFGLVIGLMATSSTGAAIVLPSPAFDPRATLSMAADHHATGLYGVGTMFIAMFQELDSPNPPPTPRHLVKGIAAGSPVPPSLMKSIHARLGLEELVICYGMTETSPVSAMTVPWDPPSVRSSTVGRAMPHTAVKITSRDRKSIVPVGERGELACSGYLLMKGYYNDEKRTAESLVQEEDGLWMYTGDEAEMDAEGYVRVTGRIKDLIIRAGENIHPLEVEECVYGVKGVRDVAVCGVADDILGEAVAAFIILEGGYTADQLGGKGEKGGEKGEKVLTRELVRGHVRSHLAAHLVPKYVFFVEEYPKTASGKVQRFQLQEMVKDRLTEGL